MEVEVEVEEVLSAVLLFQTPAKADKTENRALCVCLSC